MHLRTFKVYGERSRKFPRFILSSSSYLSRPMSNLRDDPEIGSVNGLAHHPPPPGNFFFDREGKGQEKVLSSHIKNLKCFF